MGAEAVWARQGFLFIVRVSEPVAGRGPFTLCDLEEELLDFRRNRAASTTAHRNPVDRTNRGDFRRGSGEEKLIGNVKRGALNRALLNGNPQLLTDLNHT